MTPRLALVLAAYLAVTYLVCGIPFGKIVAGKGAGVDIQKVGSGNIGTTNVARSVGKGAAALTLLLDAGKAYVCCALARPALAALALGGDAGPLAFGGRLDWVLALVFACALCGHVFSPYMRLHGGKGIAAGFGAALGLAWPVALGLLAVWLVVVVPTRIVSAASCAAAASLPLWCYGALHPSGAFLAIVCAGALLVVWAHRSNLRKLARGEEARFAFHRRDDDREGPEA